MIIFTASYSHTMQQLVVMKESIASLKWHKTSLCVFRFLDEEAASFWDWLRRLQFHHHGHDTTTIPMGYDGITLVPTIPTNERYARCARRAAELLLDKRRYTLLEAWHHHLPQHLQSFEVLRSCFLVTSEIHLICWQVVC